REFKGKVIGTDPKTDLALIKVKSLGLHFNERKVGLGVGADDLPFELPLVRERDGQFTSSVYHMVVGDNVPVRRHDHPRAHTAVPRFWLVQWRPRCPPRSKELLHRISHSI